MLDKLTVPADLSKRLTGQGLQRDFILDAAR
jgi:hypothetical protein